MAVEDEKKQFSSGATSSGQLPYYECLTNEMLDRVAQRMTEGARKYGKFNWQKGLNDKEFIQDRLNHAFKHLRKLMSDIDADIYTYDDDDDAAGVVCNMMMIMEYQKVHSQNQVNQEVNQESLRHSEEDKHLYLLHLLQNVVDHLDANSHQGQREMARRRKRLAKQLDKHSGIE